ncbi:MAG TPA: hypothetical protein VMD59_14595 [Acidimicrobiales bacterium]|nr:hypothetical protein [Acidimicrobiales bacterium]
MVAEPAGASTTLPGDHEPEVSVALKAAVAPCTPGPESSSR